MDAQTELCLVREIVELEAKAEEFRLAWKAKHQEYIRAVHAIQKRRADLLNQYRAGVFQPELMGDKA